MSPTTLDPAPAELVAPDGTVAFGNGAGAIADINWEAFDYRVLARAPWTWTRGGARKLFKRWQFVGAVDADLVIGAAVAHVQYLGTGFAYVFDRRSGRLAQHNLKAPLARRTAFSRSPVDGTSEIAGGGGRIVLDNTVRDGHRSVQVDFGEALQVRLRLAEPGTGVSTTCPQGNEGFHYTYKSAGLTVEGEVVVDGETTRLGDEALALFDWTASTPPRQTTWNWACGAGRDAQGKPVGLNFSRGLVGGPFSQNAIWLDGEPHIVGPANFAYDPQDIAGHPWRLTTADGLVDLAFTPVAERHEDIDLFLVASGLHQPFGEFEGTFLRDGGPVPIRAYGFCEQHYAKW